MAGAVQNVTSRKLTMPVTVSGTYGHFVLFISDSAFTFCEKYSRQQSNPSLVWAPVTHFFVSFTLMHSMPLDAAGQRNFTIFVPCQVAKDL